MTIPQNGLGSLGGADVTRWVQNREQELSTNSFTENLSAAFSSVPSSQQTSTSVPGGDVPSAAHSRQLTDVSGRNLATATVPTAAGTPSTATTTYSSPMGGAGSAAATAGTAGKTATTGTAAAPAAAAGSTSVDVSGMPPAEAAVYGLEASNPIVDGLLQQNAQPATYAPVGAASTDPAVFRTDGYIKELNLNTFLACANHDNTYRFNQYKNALHEWSEHGMQGDPPPPPKYESVDLKGYDNWWASYAPGYDEPTPTSFVANGPKDGGYGWTA